MKGEFSSVIFGGQSRRGEGTRPHLEGTFFKRGNGPKTTISQEERPREKQELSREALLGGGRSEGGGKKKKIKKKNSWRVKRTPCSPASFRLRGSGDAFDLESLKSLLPLEGGSSNPAF